MLRIESLQVRHVGPVNICVAAGECVALSGPSGSGKTLLLRAIADLQAHSGECLLDGKRAQSMAPAVWRSQVGYLAAESAWWHDTVAPHFAHAQAMQRPKLGDLANLANLANLGFAPEVMQWSVARLSTGERQRLALARLLSGQPKVLLLDEPTANLDAANAQAIEQLITRCRDEQQAAVLWVAHDAAQLGRVAQRSGQLSNQGQFTWA